MVRLNQTLIKHLKKDQICPRQTKEVFIDRTVSISSESKSKGLIFEELCLEGTNITSMPTLKTGGIPTEYKRISEQGDYFRNEIVKEFGLVIEKDKCWIPLSYKWSEEIELFGELDFMSPVKDEVLGEIPMAIHDIKLTGSLFKQWGNFSWAFPFNLDHTQAYMYNWLAKQTTGFDLPFYYWVFDYSTDKNFKVFRKEISHLNKMEFEESVRLSGEKYKFLESGGWDVEVPNYENCKDCPLRTNCKSANKKKSIEVI